MTSVLIIASPLVLIAIGKVNSASISNNYGSNIRLPIDCGDIDIKRGSGNDKLHKLTAQDEYELLITMQDFGNQKRYARYSNFKVGNEATKFNMTYSKFTGDVGDSLKHHNGHGFTTKDQDNDSNSGNCAVSYKGAWWYGTCHDSNLNGQYLGGEHSSDADGVNWNHWKGYHYSLKATSMMLRRME